MTMFVSSVVCLVVCFALLGFGAVGWVLGVRHGHGQSRELLQAMQESLDASDRLIAAQRTSKSILDELNAKQAEALELKDQQIKAIADQRDRFAKKSGQVWPT